MAGTRVLSGCRRWWIPLRAPGGVFFGQRALKTAAGGRNCRNEERRVPARGRWFFGLCETYLIRDPERGTYEAIRHGVVCMVSLGLVPRLVMKVAGEPEDVRELVLSTLSCCVRVDALSALISNGVRVLREQLAHPSTDIRRAAASAMLAISVPLEGKVKVCEEEVLPVAVRLLSDADPGVSANAAGIIMNTAVITRGKFQALEAGVLSPLLRLVESEDLAVCVNALRALTCLAEAPRARTQLLQHLPQLQARLHHPEPIIQRASATAIQVISWTP
ncbi:hypothetical protein NFI96_026339 [Prochilodus magdalenae]|nr:hypothetical protein NFI96_026339 [Prochilodus magdalenae]